MLTKFLDFDKIYNFCFNEKIVTQKNLSLQAFVIATLENSFGRSTLVYFSLQGAALILSSPIVVKGGQSECRAL